MNNIDVAGRPTNGSGTAQSDLCRLSVRTEHTQVDLAVPHAVSVAMIVPGIVDLIDQHAPFGQHCTADLFGVGEGRTEAIQWALSRLGQAPLDAARTLAEHGVRDGELLVLTPTERAAPPPLFDDLMHNVAAADADRHRRWGPGPARAMGAVVAAAAAVVGSATLLTARSTADSVAGALAALVVAVLALTAGALVSRVYRDRYAATALVGCALPLAFTAGALMVPGHLGAAHLFLGSVACGVFAVLAVRAGGVGLALCTATATGAVLAGAAAAAGMLTDQPRHVIGAVLGAAALAGLAIAPRLSILLAALPLPPVPSPGTPLDPDEPDSDAGGVPAAFEGLQTRARRAHRHLTGLVSAMALTTVAGALMSARLFADDGIYWPGTMFASVCAVVLMLRGRGHSSLAPAAALIGSGAATLALLVTGAAVAGTGPSLALFALAVLGAGAALTLGMLAPEHAFSPVTRRSVEIVDYAAIAAVVPLACWVSGLFATMRGL